MNISTDLFGLLNTGFIKTRIKVEFVYLHPYLMNYGEIVVLLVLCTRYFPRGVLDWSPTISVSRTKHPHG